MPESSMLGSPITIFGAGIGGLALGQCLRNEGITSILYEKVSSSSSRHNYGITLHQPASETLSNVLNLDSQTFRQRVAVDRSYHNGQGKVYAPKYGRTEYSTSFRANRSKLETLLREGLDIRWEHSLQDITPRLNNDRALSLTFQTGQTVTPPSLVIDALGVHSPLRKALLPNISPNILPYVVFSGKRRITRAAFQTTYAGAFSTGNCLDKNLQTNIGDQVLLQININDHLPSGDVDISYIYSRPARNADSLHRPDRPNTAATDTPEEFYTELGDLLRQARAEEPYATTFDISKVRSDRVLHWLMRTTLPPRSADAIQILVRNEVAVIGDSIHATPILGGDGANSAILDAENLAKGIAWARSGGNNKQKQFSSLEFYDDYLGRWTQEVADSEKSIAEMHQKMRPVL